MLSKCGIHDFCLQCIQALLSMKVRLNDDLENLQCPICKEQEEAEGLQDSGPRIGLIGIEDMTALFYDHEEIPRLF
jgi:hypothetical protein